jgi:hypothetical protein
MLLNLLIIEFLMCKGKRERIFRFLDFALVELQNIPHLTLSSLGSLYIAPTNEL